MGKSNWAVEKYKDEVVEMPSCIIADVKSVGHGGAHVGVPKAWLGKKVRIEVIEG